MHDRQTLTCSLSVQVLQYLRDKDYSPFEVARLLGDSESFISAVQARERGLTLDHMESLSNALKMPLGALLSAITRPHTGGGEFVRTTDRIMEQADQVLKLIKEQSSKTKA